MTTGTRWLMAVARRSAFRNPRLTGPLLAVVLVVCGCVGAGLGRAAEREPAPTGLLRLQRGDFVTGHFADHADPQQIAWQHPDFDAPFTFPLRSISSAGFAPPADVQSAAGEFCVELENGDRWFGSLLDVDDQQLQLRSPAHGDLSIRRERIRRLFRWNDGAAVHYQGPGSLTNWHASGGENAWLDIGGQLRTSEPFASLYADVSIPARGQIELELSWDQPPNFVIALGVNDDPESAEQAFRLEVWNQTLVMLRERSDSAVIAELTSVAEKGGRLRLTIQLDQIADHVVVFSEQGKQLAELRLPAASSDENEPPPMPGIRIENIRGAFQLESLRVVGPAGNVLAANPSGDSRIHLTNNESVDGQLARIDDGQWVIATGGEERTVAPSDVIAVSFPRGSAPGDSARESSQAEAAIHMGVATYGGVQATGQLERVADGRLFLRPAGVEGVVPVELNDLRSVAIQAPDRASPSPPSPDLSTEHLPSWYTEQELPEPPSQVTTALRQRIGRLELGISTAGAISRTATQLHGRLADAEAGVQASGLRFQPLDAANAAIIRQTASGRLVYRDRQPTPPPRAGDAVRAEPPPPGILGVFVDVFSRPGGAGAREPGSQNLYLRSGDVLPCTIERIDAEKVVFNSPAVGATEVPHHEVRAISLLSGGVDAIDDSKRERLLTVPRMRKKSPPTHLIASVDGDFLRGRLHWLDDQTLAFENRLETIEIPRRSVAQIIWFHEDELEAESTAAEPAGENASAAPSAEGPATRSVSSGLQVQAVYGSGTRLTFEPREVGGGELIGESPLLGLCLVDLSRIDALLIGDGIDAALVRSPFHAWRLTHAAEPKYLQEDGGGGAGTRMAGVDSPLVGTEAPDFELDLLGGDSFRLSEQRGTVVVLDFWATWCGPCIQAMPQVDGAVAAFPADQVRLVAVNLQEAEEPIRATLERLQLEPTVALDIDGVVASRYQANAIPQTVVIDRSGKITRLFVGGGAKLGDQLREAIQEALAATAP